MTVNRSPLHVVGLAALTIAVLSGPALAQEVGPVETGTAREPYLKGRFMMGATWGPVVTLDEDLGNLSKVAPFFRMNSRRQGWGPSFGLSWLTTELRAPLDGQRIPVGTVKLRPVMAGVGYSLVTGRARGTLGLVVGYTFNRATLDKPLPAGVTGAVHIKNAWAAGPKADVVYAMTRRLALVGSVAYVFSNPDVSVRLSKNGQPAFTATDHVRCDAFGARVGLAVSLF